MNKHYVTINNPLYIAQMIQAVACVYIVDDDDAVRDSLQLLMEVNDFCCHTYTSAEDFLQAFSPDMTGCLILDVNMPGISGIELQQELIKLKSQLPIIFLTGFSDEETKERATKAGAIDFLAKPVISKLLIGHLKSLLH